MDGEGIHEKGLHNSSIHRERYISHAVEFRVSGGLVRVLGRSIGGSN